MGPRLVFAELPPVASPFEIIASSLSIRGKADSSLARANDDLAGQVSVRPKFMADLVGSEATSASPDAPSSVPLCRLRARSLRQAPTQHSRLDLVTSNHY